MVSSSLRQLVKTEATILAVGGDLLLRRCRTHLEFLETEADQTAEYEIWVARVFPLFLIRTQTPSLIRSVQGFMSWAALFAPSYLAIKRKLFEALDAANAGAPVAVERFHLPQV